MRKKIFYSLILCFCISLIALSKDNTATCPNIEKCKQKMKAISVAKLPVVKESATEEIALQSPIAILFSWQI